LFFKRLGFAAMRKGAIFVAASAFYRDAVPEFSDEACVLRPILRIRDEIAIGLLGRP